MRMLVYMTTQERHEIETRFKDRFSSGEVELAIVNFGKQEAEHAPSSCGRML